MHFQCKTFSCYPLLYLWIVKKQRRLGHTVSWLTAHIVWVTKYRYHVLKGDIQKRCRDLVKQVCDSEDVRILKGVVSKDHVHVHTNTVRLRILVILSNAWKVEHLDAFKQNIQSWVNVIGVGIFGLLVMVFGVQTTLLMRWYKSILNIIEILRIQIRIILFWNKNFILLRNLWTCSP